MKRRLLALLLTLAMILPCLMGEANAVLKDTSDEFFKSYSFTTFKDLKKIEKMTFSGETHVSYVGTKDFVFSDDLKMPKNTVLSFYDPGIKVTVAKGAKVTTSLAFFCANLDVNGTLNIGGYSEIYDSLTVDGTINSKEEIRVIGSTGDPVVVKPENINFSGDGKLALNYEAKSFSDLKRIVSIAKKNPEYAYRIDWSKRRLNVTSSLTLPANVILYVQSMYSIIIEEGATLTVNNYAMFSEGMEIRGTLVNNGEIDLYLYDTPLSFSSGAKYAGRGELRIYDYLGSGKDYLVGLDLDDFEVKQMKKYISLRKKLESPTVKSSVDTATGKPKLSWSKVSGAEKYRIYRATSKSGDYKYLKSTASCSFIDTSAVAGKTYYYKIKALDEDSNTYSAYSNTVSRLCDLAKPKVTIKLKNGDPRLTWEKVSKAEKYEVWRATSKDGSYKLVKTTKTSTSFTDTATSAGTRYYYKVRAVHSNASANSAYSSVKSITAK